MNNILRTSSLLLITLFLGACASFSPRPPVLTPSQQRHEQHMRRQLSAWTIHSAIALRLPQKSLSLFANWQQSHDGDYVVKFFGPAGASSVELRKQASLVTLTESNGRVYQDHSANALLLHVLGWQIPVEQLNAWIKGLPADRHSNLQYDVLGHIHTITSGEWRIEYLDFMTVNQLILPKKILITNPTKELQLKVVINEWGV